MTSLNNSDESKFSNTNALLNTSKILNNKRSCGVDNISNYLIKKFPIKAFEYFAILFNSCLNNCYFPSAWKIAKIVPIPKQKGNCDINKYRPISLLSNLEKLFDKVIREKIDIGFDEEYISQNQYGFNRGKSTVHALLKFHNDIIQNLRKGHCTVAVSLDIEKAFDKAYHDGIYMKN